MRSYGIGYAVLLSDGRRAIITGYGIYENQYWCEVADAKGINLGGADYFSCDGSPPVISSLLPVEIGTILAEKLKVAVEQFGEKYKCDSILDRYTPLIPFYGEIKTAP